MRLLTHPAFTGAVALLAVNDHLLKPAVATWWTGKLSDFAGVFVVAVVLAVLTARPRLATALTGLGFAALKVSPLVASLASPVLGGHTGQDTTDLIALAALWPAFRFAAARMTAKPEPAAAGSVLTAVAGGTALLALTATSCVVEPVVDGFALDGGVVYARSGPDSDAPGGSTATTIGRSPMTVAAAGARPTLRPSRS